MIEMNRLLNVYLFLSTVLVPELSITYAMAQNGTNEVYTINAAEALNGPKPTNPKYIYSIQPSDGQPAEANITVNTNKIIAHINPLIYGACFEDLNHEIYGGLYAQMLFGESFEEGPEDKLPEGWIFHMDEFQKNPMWKGMWCSENDALGMTGFRWYKIFWQKAPFENGTLDCDLMQPEFDPGGPIGISFRARGPGFGQAYEIKLECVNQRLELFRGTQKLAGSNQATKLGQWLHLHVEVQGGTIRVFADNGTNPVLEATDPTPLPPGLVGFDSTGTRAWFRKLTFETGGKTFVPPLTPARAPNWRGPVSQWWDPIVTGDADVAFGWDSENPFNSLRSQKIEMRSGKGTAGVANRGLGREGLSVAQNQAYAGRIYVRGNYSGSVTVALQSADGTKTYCSQPLGSITADWQKMTFNLKSDTTDPNARFAVWIDQPGTIWVDQAVLFPTGDGLYKGLPVRADLAHAVLDSGITCIRLGGDYSGAPGYKWKTMLGDPDLRPQYNSPWYPFETRGWGIIDFIAFCRAAGIEPIPCVNGNETPQDLADLVEFCNGNAASTWGAKRIAMGYAEPFKLKFIQLGNGCPPLDRLVAAADAMHAVDPDLKLLTGSVGHVIDVLPSNDALDHFNELLKGKVYAVAAYPYNSEITGPSMWQLMVNRLSDLSKASIKIYSQEVNGGNHNLLRGLNDAAFNNVTERNGNEVEIVTYCGMLEADNLPDNGWQQGRIFFDNHHCWLQPHGWTLRMARDNYEPSAVEATEKSPQITFSQPIHYGVPEVDALSVGATRSEDGKELVIKVVNFASFALRTGIQINGMDAVGPQMKIVQLTGGNLDDENSALEPDKIKPVVQESAIATGNFAYTFPAYSYTILKIQ